MELPVDPKELNNNNIVGTEMSPISPTSDSSVDKSGSKCCCHNFAQRFQVLILGSLENIFQKYGRLVTKYPAVFIIICVVITGACSAGFVFFEEEKDQGALWLDQDLDYVKYSNWLKENFPSSSRFSSLIFIADNILEPSVIQQMLKIYKDISSISEYPGYCRKIPIISPGGGGGGSCAPTGTIQGFRCLESSLLEFWMGSDGNYDEAAINSLTLSQVITDINDPSKTSGVTGRPLDATQYLGSFRRDSNDKIISASAMTMGFIGVNDPNITAAEGIAAEKDDENKIDKSKLFEEKFLRLINEESTFSSLTVYPMATRSFGDEIGGNIQNDLSMLAAGYLLIFVYVCLNLGKINMVEHRVLLSMLGVLAVGMGIISSYGLCLLMGFMYTGLHSLLPFLMLGIGIDDMFVIVQCWNNLDQEEREQQLIDRFGKAMKHAGVAITITSLTDFLAFGIGATTSLPALGSFCVFAAVGILFIFFYQTTFFLAWFSLDQRRIEDRRNGCICCYKHNESWSPTKCSQVSLFNILFEKLATLLVKLPVKIAILVVTAGFLAAGIFGTTQLVTDFDIMLWIDEGTYLRNFTEATSLHFPKSGQPATFYMTQLDYAKDMGTIDRVVKKLRQREADILQPGSVISWHEAFVEYVNTARSLTGSNQLPGSTSYTSSQFSSDLSDFLFSSGKPFSTQFKFSGKLVCGQPAPPVLLSTISFTHQLYWKSSIGISAMKDVFEIVEGETFSKDVFVQSQSYQGYFTIDIITMEVIRNVSMAIVVVFLTTLFLIADILTCLIVVLSVLFSIVNVAGFAQFWGLTVDTIFAIFITISLGLCVDYSAHIAHCFMVEDGSRDERMRKTLVKIGPAVLNGGLSTFFAFVLLSLSKSYIFFTFFKIFFMVVVFGLFHGLLFLPVVLSLIGPSSHIHTNATNTPIPIPPGGLKSAGSRDAWHGKDNNGFIQDEKIMEKQA